MYTIVKSICLLFVNKNRANSNTNKYPAGIVFNKGKKIIFTPLFYPCIQSEKTIQKLKSNEIRKTHLLQYF